SLEFGEAKSLRKCEALQFLAVENCCRSSISMKARNLNGYVKKVIGGKQDLMTSNTASRWRGRKNSFARVNGPPHTPVSPRYSFEISAKSVASRLCLDHPATGRTLHLARNLILQRSAFAF